MRRRNTRKLKKMRFQQFSKYQLLGSSIRLGGIVYTLVRIFRLRPEQFDNMQVTYKGSLQCFHETDQLAWVLRKRDKRFLSLMHPVLQDRHKGSIHLYAQLSEIGRCDGEDCWLRLPPDFPAVPSAKYAERLPRPKPWRKRRKNAKPLEPLFEVEELLVERVDERPVASDDVKGGSTK